MAPNSRPRLADGKTFPSATGVEQALTCLRRPTPRSQALLLLTALSSAEIVAAFESGMIWAAVRVLQEMLGDSVRVGWVMSAYYLVAAGAAVVGARLGDLMGRTRVLIIVLLVSGIGSLICALLSEDFTMLLLGRCIQGVSTAILPLCYGLVREHMPAQKVMPSVGLLAGTMTSASTSTTAESDTPTCILPAIIGGVVATRWYRATKSSAPFPKLART